MTESFLNQTGKYGTLSWNNTSGSSFLGAGGAPLSGNEKRDKSNGAVLAVTASLTRCFLFFLSGRSLHPPTAFRLF